MMLNLLKREKAIVTWSGGLDTTSLIPYVIEEYDTKVFPLFVNRKQENYEAEARAISYFTSFFLDKYPAYFQKPIEVFTIIPPQEFKKMFPQADVEKTHALRNSDIVNQAVRYALILDVNLVLVGSNINDVFSDNAPSYWQKKTEEIRQGTNNDRLLVFAPFQELGWDKKNMVLWCYNHGIPIHKSWSCWKTYEKHCGVCSPCKRRKDAFKRANIRDITGYLE